MSHSHSGSKGFFGSTIPGTIMTAQINATHTQIKEIIASYKNVNLKVNEITRKVKKNWVGEGRNEFETQYNLLIRKIDDFGDALDEIYDMLLEAELAYQEMDEQYHQQVAVDK